jgi:hypothetical protein
VEFHCRESCVGGGPDPVGHLRVFGGEVPLDAAGCVQGLILPISNSFLLLFFKKEVFAFLKVWQYVARQKSDCLIAEFEAPLG